MESIYSNLLERTEGCRSSSLERVEESPDTRPPRALGTMDLKKRVFVGRNSWKNAYDDPRRDDCSRGFTWDAVRACRQAKITSESGVTHGFRDRSSHERADLL